MNPSSKKLLLLLSLCLVGPPMLVAQESPDKAICEFYERYSDWPEDLKINGSLLVSDSIEGFNRYIVSSDYTRKNIKQWVVVGSIDSTKSLLLANESYQAISLLSKMTWTQQIPPIESLDADTMLVVCDDRPFHEIPKERFESMGQAIEQHLSKGAMACFVGPACVASGKLAIDINASKELADGLGLIPDALVCFNENGECEPSVCEVLKADHRCVLLTIAKGNSWVLQGRKGMLYGPGTASTWVGSGEYSQNSSISIQARSQSNRNEPESYLLDWTQWRRLAIERTLERDRKSVV